MDLPTVEAVTVPRTRAELMAAVAAPGAALLAGGTWLFSEPQPQVRSLVDLTGLGWPPLTVSEAGLEIAATCTVAQLDALPQVPGWAAQALIGLTSRDLVASFKVQHVATVGGNIALGLPAGAMTSLATALDGVAVVWGSDGGSRLLPVAELVTGPGETGLRPGEVLRGVRLPARALQSRAAHRQASLTSLGRSASVVIGRVDTDGSVVVSVTAALPRPLVVRLPALAPAATFTDAVLPGADAVGWYDDVHGASDWRRAVTRVLLAEVHAELAGA